MNGRAAVVFIVNAPPGFSLAFALVTPMVRARTLVRFKLQVFRVD